MLIIKAYGKETHKQVLMQSQHQEIHGIIGTYDTVFIDSLDYRTYFINAYGKCPNAIIFFYNIQKHVYERMKKDIPETKIIIWSVDIHHLNPDFAKNVLKYSYELADIHLCHYPKILVTRYNINPKTTVIPMYHSCGKFFEKSKINSNSINKIFIYGFIHAEIYPLRTWFLNEIKKVYPDRVVCLDHPGYPGYPGYKDSLAQKTSINTADELYKYTISYTSSGCALKTKLTDPHYLLGKFFEITGAGVLLLCNDKGVREELNSLGFYDMVNYVNIDENNFKEKIEWLFNEKNANDITIIRKAGHKHVIDNHLTSHRIDFVNNSLTKLLTV